MTKINNYRAYKFDNSPDIVLCEHISIEGHIDDNDCSEYEQTIIINCKLCKIKHIIHQLVN